MKDVVKLNSFGEPIYFDAPIELWRDFLNQPDMVLNNVLAYASAAYENETDAEERLGVSYGNWSNEYNHGKELRNTYRSSKVNFSISSSLYWDYKENKKSDYDRLLLLAYLALNSMKGGFTFTNSTFWISRMAGYGSMADFKEDWKKNKDGGYNYKVKCIPPNRFAKYIKNQRMLGRNCAKLRFDLMRHFDYIHFYSEQGKRDFAFKFDAQTPRQECMNELARVMYQRGKTTKRNELKEMMEQAKEAARK